MLKWSCISSTLLNLSLERCWDPDMRSIQCLLRWHVLSLPSPTCINIAKVFPTLLFWGCWYMVVEHYRSIVWQRQCLGWLLSFASFDFTCFISFYGYLHWLVLPNFRVVAESCMDVFHIPLPSCISLWLSCWLFIGVFWFKMLFISTFFCPHWCFDRLPD